MSTATSSGLLLLLVIAAQSYHVPYNPPQYVPSPYNPPPPPARAPSYSSGYDPDLRPPPPPPHYGQPWVEKPPWHPPPNYVNQGGYYQPPPGPGGYVPNPRPPFGESITTTQPPPQTTPEPMEEMADVVNFLGTRVLQDHVKVRGNFAFSPYGATSVLCVLTEGASGNSMRQLASVLALPRDPGTVRVGMRDLHRHLKSYFGHNGFLQGVDLSQNKSSLRDDFLPVLRLYGYHVEDDSMTTTEPSAEMTSTVAPGEDMGTTPGDSSMDGSNMETDKVPDQTTTEDEMSATTEEQMQEVVDQEMTSQPPDYEQVSTLEPSEAPEQLPTEPPEEEENATEDAAARRRRKRSASKNVLFPDLALSNGMENSTNVTEPDPLATRKRFWLFSGASTRAVPVLERREMLPFASLPQLGAIAAMLPLDEPRYGLLVLLPKDKRPQALLDLARDLTEVPLRRVQNALRPERLHSIVPAFNARGPVVLTSSLQQLGIYEVFDPRRARLDKMSTDPGLYVRELEQNVRVDFGSVRAVQTRLHVDKSVITARSTPEVVDAMRPFLYFVVDRYTQAALLAGKVEDPSTPRIF